MDIIWDNMMDRKLHLNDRSIETSTASGIFARELRFDAGTWRVTHLPRLGAL